MLQNLKLNTLGNLHIQELNQNEKLNQQEQRYFCIFFFAFLQFQFVIVLYMYFSSIVNYCALSLWYYILLFKQNKIKQTKTIKKVYYLIICKFAVNLYYLINRIRAIPKCADSRKRKSFFIFYILFASTLSFES